MKKITIIAFLVSLVAFTYTLTDRTLDSRQGTEPEDDHVIYREALLEMERIMNKLEQELNTNLSHVDGSHERFGITFEGWHPKFNEKIKSLDETDEKQHIKRMKQIFEHMNDHHEN